MSINRRPAQIKPTHINVILHSGGIGDMICTMPAINYLLRTQEHVWIHLYVPDYFVELGRHLLKDSLRCFVKPMSRLQSLSYNSQLPGYTNAGHMFTTLRAHLVDHAFANLTDTGPTMLDKHDRDYLRLDVDKIDLSSFSLPSDYVVVTTGYTAKSREWPAKEINKVSSWVVKQGLTPVFLGSKIASVGYGNDIIGNFDNDVDHTVGVDLIGKTSLLEAGAILAKARAVVGVDNGLIHLAACSLVPIVVGFTNADKRTRLPIRRGKEGWMVRSIVPENLPCSGCQTKYHYLFEADFRECLFNDFECTKQMTGERFIAALEEFLQ